MTLNSARGSYQVDRASAPRRAAVPKRVALFTGAYNHIADGVSRTLNRLVTYLEGRGVSVVVFAPTVEHPPVEHAGRLVPVPSVAAPGRPDYRIAAPLTPALREEVARFRPTLFHVATPDVLGLSALQLARSWDVPVVASYHTHFSSYLRYYGLGRLEGLVWAYLRWFYRACDQVYVPSPSMAEVLRDRGVAADLRLWARGVDTARFNPVHRSAAWRRAQGIQDEEVVVAFVGRLVWEKGLHVFADVAGGLRTRGVRFRSLVVGDGPARAELQHRLPNAIFTGHLDGEALSRAYASSDVFLFPSDTETFGNVTLEAMASGVPPVCADATGSRSLVEPGATGFLARPGDAGDFARHVERLLRDAALRQRLGVAARARAQHYAWEAVMERLLGYYDDVLASRTSPLRVAPHPNHGPRASAP